jgi:hypothetical protein
MAQLCLAIHLAACVPKGTDSAQAEDRLGSPDSGRATTTAPLPTEDGSSSQAIARPLEDAATPAVPSTESDPFDGATSESNSEAPLPHDDAATSAAVALPGQDAATSACPSSDDSLDGGTVLIYSHPGFGSEEPYIPEDSGADGQLCWTLCSTTRCIPFANEFNYDGFGDDCVDACLASYQHARAHAPQVCLDALAHRDEVYLSAPCDCNAAQVAATISSQIDRVCSLSPSEAEAVELGTECTRYCDELSPTDGGATPCFDNCVADHARYWLLGGSRCLRLQLELLTCRSQVDDETACEGEAAYYACLQATR